MVCNRSGAGNYHFLNLQMITNDVRKAKKALFSTGNAIQSLLTETTLVGLSIEQGVLCGYILNKQQNAQKFVQKTE